MKETKDILVTFENLNNHEVFTPPRIANTMLDLLPKDIWMNPNAKILDPAVKTGVFLRESFYRLFEGLKGKGTIIGLDRKEYNLNIPQQRINHILKNMLFGIATSELTGYIGRRTLYGVMKANSDKVDNALESLLKVKDIDQWDEYKKDKFIDTMTVNDYFDFSIFENDVGYEGYETEGNIFYPTSEVQKRVIEEDNYEIEDIFYPFIEDEVKHKKIRAIKGNEMKFDVIIGNPPYQMAVRESSAKPIYNLFIESAIKINPNFLIMIVPSRWMIGGKGLDLFRSNMLSDKRIKKIIDFKDSKECFPSVQVEGGINYFLWDKNYNGKCSFNGIDRDLDQYDILVRNSNLLPVLEKVLKESTLFLNQQILGQNPFNLNTNFKDYSPKPLPSLIKMYGNKANMKRNFNILDGVGYVNKKLLKKNIDLINKYKVIVPAANGNNTDIIIGTPFLSEPHSVCTQTYIILDIFDNEMEAYNLINYIKSKFVRFLISIRKNTQHASPGVYSFVPLLDMTKTWTDEILYKKYNLTQEEIDYIESSIKEMV